MTSHEEKTTKLRKQNKIKIKKKITICEYDF